jgi:hypothetical protein
MYKRSLILTALLCSVALAATIYAQSRGTPSTLRVRIDANGSLVVASAAQVNPVTTVTFNNARLAVDSSGNLLTVISGGSGVGTVTSVAVQSPISTLSGPGNPITTTGTITCPTCATVTATLGQFTTTNSATFAGVISNETGFDGANGVLVFSKSPTLTLENGTLLPVATGISGFGTGVATALATNIGSVGAFVTFNGALGTPSSGTLTNATGLPVAGLSNLGTNVGTFLVTPSSANLLSAITDETGTGVAVFGTSPTFTTSLFSPLVIGGTAVGSSLTLQSTNATGTTDSILFTVGTNGGTTAAKVFDSGFWLYGPASTSGNYGTIPAAILHTVSTSGNQITNDKIIADATSAGIIGRKARGTVNTPTQTLAADNLMVMIGQGWETTTPGWTSAANGQIGIQATENFTSSAQGTRLTFNLTPTGSVTAARVLTLSTSGMIFSQNSGTAMAVANVGANSCGTTTATIAGNQTVGEVTVGATSGTQCREAVPQATTTRFNGSCRINQLPFHVD